MATKSLNVVSSPIATGSQSLQGTGVNLQGGGLPLQGSSSAYLQGSAPSLQVASSPTQLNSGTQISVPTASKPAAVVKPAATTPAVTTPAAASTSVASGVPSTYAAYLQAAPFLNGVQYNLSTPAGQLAYYNANKAYLDQQSQVQLGNLQKTLNSNLTAAAATHEADHSTLEDQASTIEDEAKAYAGNYATQAVSLENSHGNNLAQIGSTYSSASPEGFQSSEADDTDYANQQFQQGTALLNDNRNATVGANYIQGTNPDGTLQLGSLDPTSAYGKQADSTTQQLSALDTSYGNYVTDQNNGYNESVQANNVSENKALDSVGTNLDQIDAYSGSGQFNPGSVSALPTTVPNLTASQLAAYTSSPLTATAANSTAAASSLNFAPTATSAQTPTQTYLGYTPSTAGSNYLADFLKGS